MSTVSALARLSGAADRRATRHPLIHHLRTLWIALLSAPLTVGGQAVLEGVMMRSPASFSVAVRRRDGSIVVREQRVNNFLSRFKIFRWPLMRGAIMLIESLINGLSALNFAADQAMADENDSEQKSDEQGEAKTKAKTPPVAGSLLLSASGGGGSTGGDLALWGTLALSLVLGMGLFVGLPHLLTYLVGLLVPGGLQLDGAAFHLVDGGFKMGIFILYIVLISQLDDIRRLFMYHGAEHKSVHCFERKLPLVVDSAREMSTAHPRCGTSLILWVVTISIFVHAAVFPFVPPISEHVVVNHLGAVLLKIMLSLPVAGIAYEVQRAAARHPDSRLVQTLIRPGMWLQSLTTREPGDAELEIALTALRKVLWREQQQQLAEDGQQVERYASFDDFVVEVA